MERLDEEDRIIVKQCPFFHDGIGDFNLQLNHYDSVAKSRTTGVNVCVEKFVRTREKLELLYGQDFRLKDEVFEGLLDKLNLPLQMLTIKLPQMRTHDWFVDDLLNCPLTRMFNECIQVAEQRTRRAFRRVVVRRGRKVDKLSYRLSKKLLIILKKTQRRIVHPKFRMGFMQVAEMEIGINDLLTGGWHN